MSKRGWWLVGAVGLLLLLGGGRVLAADDPQVSLGYDPGTTAGVISRTLAAGSTSLPLYLSSTASQSYSNTFVVVSLRDGAGQVAGAGSVSLLDPTTNALLGRFDLAQGQRIRPVTLQISNLERAGSYTGTVSLVISDSRSFKLADLQIVRLPQPSWTLSGTNAVGEIELSGTEATTATTLLLQDGSGQPFPASPAANLRAISRNPAALTLTLDRSSLIPSPSQPLVLTATMSGFGEQRGWLQIEYGGQPTTYPIRVSRPAPAAVAQAVTVTTGLRFQVERPAPFAGGELQVPINLDWSGAQTATIAAPGLQGLVASGATTNTISYCWVLSDADGRLLDRSPNQSCRPPAISSPLVPTGGPVTATTSVATGGPVTATATSVPPTPASVRLQHEQTTRLNLLLDRFGSPGSYQATLRTVAPDGSVLLTSFWLDVKDGWFVPTIVIALGVLLSYWLRRWLGVGRPQAAAQLAISNHSSNIHQLLTGAGSIKADGWLVSVLDRRLALVWQRSIVELGVSLTSDLDQIDTILNNYLRVRPVLQAESDIKKINNPTLTAKFNSLLEDVQRLRGAGLLNDAASLVAQAQAIQDAINQQQVAADATKLREQANELADILKQPDIPPGLAPSTWNTERGSWQVTLAKPDLSVADYNRVRSEYLRLVLNGLKKAAKIIAEALTEIDKEKYQKNQIANLERVQRDAAAADTNATADIGAAEYTRLSDLYRRTRDSLAKAVLDMIEKGNIGTQMSPGGQQADRVSFLGDLAANPPSALNGIPPSPLSDADVEIPSAAAILARIQLNDARAAGIAGTVTVLIGLATLWATNPTFGGGTDYLSAFIWGFGLSELNKLLVSATASQLALPLPAAAIQLK